MSIQHYQNIYHQEEREQELVASLREISIALEGFISRLKNYRSMEDIPIELIVTLIEAKKICSHLAQIDIIINGLDGWVDVWMDRTMDGWKDGMEWMDG